MLHRPFYRGPCRSGRDYMVGVGVLTGLLLTVLTNDHH